MAEVPDRNLGETMKNLRLAAEAAGRAMHDLDGDRRAYARGQDYLRARAADLEGILLDLIESADCRYDHHGNCQEHGWFDPARATCPQARARLALTESLVAGKRWWVPAESAPEASDE